MKHEKIGLFFMNFYECFQKIASTNNQKMRSLFKITNVFTKKQKKKQRGYDGKHAREMNDIKGLEVIKPSC